MARIPLAMILGLAALAAGCSTNGSDGADAGFDAASVQGSQWELVSLGGTPVIESGNKPTITFPEPGRIAGFASCNRYSGSAQVTPDGKLVLSAPNAIAVTRMACAEAALNEQETRFLQLLGGAGQMRLEGDRLSILTGERADALVFQRKP
ncbi:MAG: hypothetical protein A3E01_04455 [Gammaproteobacteria bacterium RIFCSPHIGHO2_12_FULL_63_22]|nr:MAG: hypothetical protein A3E01_04455 [Gammaproteobacteria bacterium RIFCSPHIGHO2_12_FULL_63_22]